MSVSNTQQTNQQNPENSGRIHKNQHGLAAGPDQFVLCSVNADRHLCIHLHATQL